MPETCTNDKVKYRQKLFTEVPEQPKEMKPGQLSSEQLKEFFEKGFLILHDFFNKEKLDACRKEIEELVDKLAEDLYKAGKIKNLYEEEGLMTRLIYISKEFPGANVLLMKQGKVPKSFQALWTDEKMMNIVEQIIGPDIMGHPVWNLRSKIPNNEATVVPWHQDFAYLDERALDVFQLTAWVPFVDANEINGTLQVAKDAHRSGKAGTHVCCYRGTWYVELLEDVLQSELDVDMEKDVITCPVNYGGVILFSNMLPHRSLPNLSNITRWSCDLRWQVPDKSPGFYDLKEGIVFKTKENPDLTPDWDGFNSINRDTEQLKSVGMEEALQDPFDTTISGPWMKKWEIVNVNRHVLAYKENDSLTWHAA